MRLLHLDGERLVSTDFRGKTIPPYAILSHRWGDSEVLLEDLELDLCKEKAGYRKIEFCAAQAAQDGLQYFWIDTCCIDKWDLRERSKAINSMFRWYKDAARCYVFLPDVSVATDAPQGAWETSFRASEWFTRGWTLQELIAPASVEFFSFEGWRIGDKTSLEPLVHEATGIPVEVLRNSPLDGFSIDERRGWAKHRKTTEEEDAVYCLLGILDVVIPAAYGEGAERAWRRLQTELETDGSAPSLIPYSRNDQFLGRESQLAEVEVKLFEHNQATAVAIVGPPGTGKSQLALEVAHRTILRNKDCSVFWIDASDIDSLYRSYDSVAQKLSIPGWDDEKADSRQLVKAYLGGRGEHQYLLVFDNADEVSLGSSGMPTGAVHLSDYLPQSGRCAILYTTTNRDTAETLTAPNIVELQEMTSSTAQSMLESHLPTLLSGSVQQEAQLLLRELSYLPLAVVQAAAYITARSITLPEYRLLVAKQKEAAPGHGSELQGDRPQEPDTTGPVAITLLISLDHLRGDVELAAKYLFLAACVDRKDIPLDLLPSSSSHEKEEAVKVLRKYGLVVMRPAESSLDLHQLVHRALRECLQRQGLLDKWTGTAAQELYGVFPDNNHRSRSKWRRLLPHAKYVLLHGQAEKGGGDRLELARKCAMALYNDGRWKEAEELEVQVMETSSRVLGDEHPDTLISMNNLASTYSDQGRWKEAEELEVQVMETRKRVLGDEHPDTLTSIANLALTYSDQGRWKEAEELEVQVIETSSRVLGDEHPDTLISMNNLASTYSNQGRWKEAEELFMQVMETRKSVLSDEHPSTLTSMANLASTYSKQGWWKKAEELEVQVIETSSRVLGDKHPDTLISMNNLASTYSNQGRWKEAEELFMQVMETRKSVLSDEHPSTLTSMNNLAFTLEGQGLYDKAILLLEQCYQLRHQVLGPKHPNTVSSLVALQAWRVGNVSPKPAR
ncbi:kinesin light chain [Paraphoma chrysanthemicola]|nr:kinesin light chain [Paraphoma chrysanthemicola]